MKPTLAVVNGASRMQPDPDVEAMLRHDYPATWLQVLADPTIDLAAAIASEEVERSVRLGSLADHGVTLCPPEWVRSIAANAPADGASLADVDLAGRICAGAVTCDDLEAMRDEDAGLHGGGAAGAEWAAEELARIAAAGPWGWLTIRADRAASTPASRLAWWVKWQREVHGPAERRAVVAVYRWLTDWRNAIVDRVPDVLGAMLGRSVTPHQRDLAAWLLALLGEEVSGAGLRAGIIPILRSVVVRALQFAARDLALSGVSTATAISVADQSVGVLITNVTQTTIDEVSALVERAFADGLSVQELQKSLMESPAFGRARALTIARTETAKVATAGTDEAMKQAQAMGVDIEQEWIAAIDAYKFERRHDRLSGVVVPVGGRWKLPSGVLTPGPGHSGVAGEDINCRCAKRAKRREENP